MSLNSLTGNTFNASQYGVDLHTTMMSNALSVFKISGIYFMEVPVDVNESNKYIGDFYGLLLTMGVPSELLYVTTVLNGLASSAEFDGRFYNIKLIDQNFASKLLGDMPNNYSLPQIK